MRLVRTVGRLAALSLTTGLLVGVAALPAQADDAVAGGQTAAPADSLFPNQGNSGYDVSHYDIAFKADFTTSATPNAVGTSRISDAVATIDARTTGAPLSSYSFDFQGSTGNLAASTLNIDSVTVDGAPATFTRIENTTGSTSSSAANDVHKLIVTPATPVSGSFTTVVRYSGRPVAHTDADGSAEGWNNTTDGATFLNQPVGAMTLFPNNNTPRDKATYTFTVDVPTKLATSNLTQAGGKPYPSAVVSNGELVSRTPSSDGSRTTWVWNEAKPMASELSMISIGRYDMYSSNITLASGRTIPEWSFIDPAIATASQTTTLATRSQLPAILDFLESKYGPYPGNSTGLVTDVVPSSINYALETQDRSFFPTSASRGTTYHEVMHQWFGDNVSPADWNDIWLNEGPATYAESQLPYEGAGGTSTTPVETTIFNSWNGTASSSSLWNTPVAAMSNAAQLFGSPTYTRGNMTLGALRTAIGTADFATLMKTWQTRYGGTSRRTSDFIALAEEVSGRDLGAFFNSWVYTTGKPAWPVKFNLNLAGPTTTVNPGDAVTYTLSVRNTGKVAMPAGGTVIAVDLSDVLDDATIGSLPTGTTLDGTTLSWAVPATALAASSSVDVPVTLNAGSAGHTLKPVARASTLGGTCVSCSPSATVGTAPTSPAPQPTISGTTSGAPVVGQALTADTTGWPSGTTFTYQWNLDGTPVPGATAASWTPTLDVAGAAVTVAVTGTKPGSGPAAATSAPTAVGVRGTLTTATPTIAGTPKIGERLTVDPGTWSPGTFFTYQWRANGTNITGATGSSYVPAAAGQVGQAIDVVVTGTKAGYTTTPRTSAATAAVAAGDPLVTTPTPTLPGAPKVGAPIAVAPGYWDDGVVLTFAWQANGNAISGATAASYTPTVAQLGQALTVTVTGTRPGVTAISKVSAPATVQTGTQTLQPTPTIAGTPRPDTAVTGVPGTWDSGTSRTYRWLVDDVAVPGETGTTYTPSAGQIGRTLTFEVTSTRAGYDTVVKTSSGATILGYAQTLTPTPTIVGEPKVDVPLTVQPGTWDDGVALAYQWKVDGQAVDGATGTTYTPGPAQLGSTITVAVTGSKQGYETVTRTSDPAGPVSKGDLTTTPTPTVSGDPKVGVELTAHPGSWGDGVTLAYQWSVDGQAVDGATGLTYTPAAADAGKTVTVAVTGSRTGYQPTTRTSDPTAPVAKGDLTSTPTPVVVGTPQVGATLRAHTGPWDDGTAFTYQWEVGGQPVSNATGPAYSPVPGDVGQTVSVAVTGTKTGYQPVTRTSDPVGPVTAGDLTATPTPTVTGDPKVGVALTARPGDWDAGTAFTYQWQVGGQPVSNATGPAYTPVPGDVGQTVSVAVTGTKTGYQPVTRTSDPVGPVTAGDLTATPTPTVTGDPKVGVELTARAGAWDDGVTLTYRWYADGQAITGAVAPTYTPGPDQLGAAITVAVTGTRTGYQPVTRTSDPTGPVATGDLTSTPTPTISGTAKVGTTLTARPGSWDEGTTLTYQWRVGDQAVSGATATTYTPVPADAGKTITVDVTGTRTGYRPVTRTSDPAGPVAAGDLTATPIPTIAGRPKVGVDLTARPGTWDPGTTLSYQWSADGVPVSGATATTYTPGPDQVGAVMTVAVTGTKAGYQSVTRTSQATSPVAKGEQKRQPQPEIKGTVRVGETLRVAPATYDAGTTVTYTWQVGDKVIDQGPTFKLKAGYVGSKVFVTAQVTKPGYVTLNLRSSGVGPVKR